MSQPSNTSKVAISLAIPFACFGALELGLVLADFRHRPVEVPIVIRSPAHGDQHGIFQIDPLSLWSPRPAAVIPWDLDERVSAAGFRGPEMALERTPGVLRIAALGDSSTFGLGLPHESCYVAQLESLLAEQGIPAEVLNAGVIGFTLAQGLERYRHHVRPYRPDVVVAAFSAVNEHYAALECDERRIEASQQKLAAQQRRDRSVRERARAFQLATWAAHGLQGASKREREQLEQARRRTAGSMAWAGQPDWPGTRRVSVERFAELARTLAREVESDGASLVLVLMPRKPPADEELPVLALYSRALATAAATVNLPLCDAARAFQEAEAEGGDWASLFLPRDRWHPSALGQALIARELAPLVEAAALARTGERGTGRVRRCPPVPGG